MSFGAFKLDTLLAFALRNGFFGPEPEDQA